MREEKEREGEGKGSHHRCREGRWRQGSKVKVKTATLAMLPLFNNCYVQTVSSRYANFYKKYIQGMPTCKIQ